MDMNKGYIHIYTGNGKGKTTAALGLALRAIGAGKSVYLGQFIKKGNYSEIKALTLLSELLKDRQKIIIEQFGTGRFITGKPESTELELASSGYAEVSEIVSSGEYDIVILDEAVTACSLGLLSCEDLIRLIEIKKNGTELIFTGRGCPDILTEKGDLVTEMNEVKHYYSEGVEAREGIEF